ncbi:hypothetical protein B0H14DRAFT_3131710 [Mycena olivaceomarginata]|nr:hypothetical protein B0H14DRAFT_3131710 [Mycena olivaceomarginata]
MGSPFPGSFSEELVPQQQNSESTLLDTANGKTYLPDVHHAVTSVGQAAKTYSPPSLTAYLPSASSLNLETNPDLAPADVPVTDDSALRTLSTQAQASSLLPPAPADSHTIILGVPLCLRPWQPNPPCSYLPSRCPLDQSAQSEGPPVPQNSLVTPSPGVFTSAPTRTHPPPYNCCSDLARPPSLRAPLRVRRACRRVRAAGCVVALERTRSHPTPGAAASKFVEGIASSTPAQWPLRAAGLPCSAKAGGESGAGPSTRPRSRVHTHQSRLGRRRPGLCYPARTAERPCARGGRGGRGGRVAAFGCATLHRGGLGCCV